MDQIAALRAFTRIVETGSFTQAALSLNTPKPTVSKLVQQLEAHLRTRLLIRTTRRLAVTSDGAAYYERAMRLLADLEELDGSISASQARPKGRLRVDVSSTLAQQIIVPALAGFFERYPDIQLHLGTSDRPADLVAENVDCVIRAGAIGDLSLVARRIGELHMMTCAAPAYLQAHGVPGHPSALVSAEATASGPGQAPRIVGFLKSGLAEALPMSFIRGAETLAVTGQYQAAVNEAATYLAVALAGHGVIQAPYVLVREHLASGALQAVLPDWEVPPLALHVVYPPNRHLSTRLRIFVDWVAALFGAAELAPAGRSLPPRRPALPGRQSSPAA